MPVVDHAELRRIGRRVFAAGGSSEEEAGIIIDHLVEANLKGHDSHGVGMIPTYLRNLGNGTCIANRAGRVVSESGSLIVYDGERGYGQVVARAATEVGIAKAKETGVAVVALRNVHHIGRVGTYGEMCADAGLVSISFVNITDQKPAVAPWRGGDARFGTNPVTIAIPGPSPDRNIISDMATSLIAMGKVRVARNKGEELKPGTILDQEGQPSVDPAVMYQQPRGALITFAEHKGYALAFICEILAGAVGGGRTMRPEHQDNGTTTNGMFMVVIDTSHLVDRAWMLDEIKAMTEYVTASPRRNADEPVLIPGDPERLSRAKRIAEGVPIDEETWREIAEAARGVNVRVETPSH
jgi:uncharacterized oxidoreductase